MFSHFEETKVSERLSDWFEVTQAFNRTVQGYLDLGFLTSRSLTARLPSSQPHLGFAVVWVKYPGLWASALLEVPGDMSIGGP